MSTLQRQFLIQSQTDKMMYNVNVILKLSTIICRIFEFISGRSLFDN